MADYDKNNPKPEIVIALAGPAGTDLNSVTTLIEETLSPYHYKTFPVKVSTLIHDWCEPAVQAKMDCSAHDERVHMLMNAGDAIRAASKTGQALIPLIISAIRNTREKTAKERGLHTTDGLEAYNVCYIINSLKHPDEVRYLREMYGPKLFVFSIFSSLESREAKLREFIAKSKNTTDNSKFSVEARGLIEMDAQRPNSELGQSLRHTFPLGDFFASTDRRLKEDVERFFECAFGNPYKTPTSDEYFMYEAARPPYDQQICRGRLEQRSRTVDVIYW